MWRTILNRIVVSCYVCYTSRGHGSSQELGLGAPSHASVVHTFEAVAGS